MQTDPTQAPKAGGWRLLETDDGWHLCSPDPDAMAYHLPNSRYSLQAHLNALETRLRDAEAKAALSTEERDEFEALFDLQRSRETEVWERWRASGKTLPLTMPDYGEAIDMLLAELENSEARAELVEAQLEAINNVILGGDALKFIVADARRKTAALLSIVRRRAGDPHLQWMRDIAISVLSNGDHEWTMEQVNAALTQQPPQNQEAGT